MRPVFLFDRVRTVRVPVDELRAADPELRTLANLNHPADYLAALQLAGFEIAPELRVRLQGRRSTAPSYENSSRMGSPSGSTVIGRPADVRYCRLVSTPK